MLVRVGARDSNAGDIPDLARLRGVVAPEILNAVEVASRMLREGGIPHALAEGLAVRACGYPRTTDDVEFFVGDEAFVIHRGGLVTLKIPMYSVGNVRLDLICFEESKGEFGLLRPAMDSPNVSQQMPIVPITALVYMKLKAGRQRDAADLVELLKRGRIDIALIDQYLRQQAPDLSAKWDRVKDIAAKEE